MMVKTMQNIEKGEELFDSCRSSNIFAPAHSVPRVFN